MLLNTKLRDDLCKLPWHQALPSSVCLQYPAWSHNSTHKHTLHKHIWHALVCTHTSNGAGMISQGLSSPCRAGSRKWAKFCSAAELFHSCQLDGDSLHFREATVVFLCSPANFSPTVILAPKSWVIPATARGLNTGLSIAPFLSQFKMFEVNTTKWLVILPALDDAPLPCKKTKQNRKCTLSSSLPFSECETPRTTGNSLEAAGSCEALH